jgi:phosphohistidine phosphatase
MITLMLLRHAKSNWDDPALADHDRPLTRRGHKAAKRMGRLIVEEKLIPDAVLCSTAVRARETWDHVADAFRKADHTPPVEFVAGLYHCPVNEFVPILKAAPVTARSLLVIGHNPGLEELLDRLMGTTPHFPTAALAVLELEIDAWAEFTLQASTSLQHLWRPRELE